jgi:hypothetical protein
MSSTIRKQQIEEIKNYNQNINRQALAKSYSQVALWELERPELTPKGTETGLKTDENVNNLNLLLNEKLVVLDRVVNTGKLTEKELNVITKFADVVRSYNTLIEPLVNSRYDNSIKTLARSALTRVKEPIVGLIIGFRQLFDNFESYNISNVKGLVESFVVYDYINYQIDKEDYKTISIELLKSRIPQIYSKVPKEIQDLYMLSQTKYEPLRATKFEFEKKSPYKYESLRNVEGPSTIFKEERPIEFDEEEYAKKREPLKIGTLRAEIVLLKSKREASQNKGEIEKALLANRKIEILEEIVERRTQTKKIFSRAPASASASASQVEDDEELQETPVKVPAAAERFPASPVKRK